MFYKIINIFKRVSKKKIFVISLLWVSSILFVIQVYNGYHNNHLLFLKKYDCPLWKLPLSWEIHPDGTIIEWSWCHSYKTSSDCRWERCTKDDISGIKTCYKQCDARAAKPIIYLYPEETQEVLVELDVIGGKLIADYPRYNEDIGWWKVLAHPDSTLIHEWKEYSYLFWEADYDTINWDLSTWFVVAWSDVREFLQEKLSYIGLTPREYNEFIVYWYPLMMDNPYNLIYFAWEDYTSKAPLTITPEPDSLFRVFTVIQPLKEWIDIPEQELEVFQRTWFSVVEWWGAILE